MELTHRFAVSTAPSFRLGVGSFDFSSVEVRGPFPPPAAEMEVEPAGFSPAPELMLLAPLPSAPLPVFDSTLLIGEGEDLSELSDVLLEGWVEPSWQGAKRGLRSGSEEFLAPDAAFQSAVSEGGDNPSKIQNQWALNRLKKFREHLRLSTSVQLVDMPPLEAVELLYLFFEHVTKKNGKLYPSGSLMNLLGGFNRVLRRKQEERIMACGIDEAPFTMQSSPLFRRVCVACVMAMRRSRAQGVGTERKQVKVVTKKIEVEILADESMAKTHTRGLFRRVGYYCIFRFAIRGGGELHSLVRADFLFGQEGECGKFVQYHERTSKNGKATMKKFQPEHFRPGVKNFEADVVDTFEHYYKHLPEGMSEFFQPVIDNPRTKYWYSRATMGEAGLSHLVKQIFEDNGLDPDDYSNKSGRTTLVTRMAEAGVPSEVGMLVTGHSSEKAYSRYDRSKEAKVRAAQRCATEHSLTYVQALEEETGKLKEIMIKGTFEESPPKRHKSSEQDMRSTKESDMSSTKESVALKFTALQLDEGSPSMAVSLEGLTSKNVEGNRVRKLKDVEDPSKWEWMKHFDWEDDLKIWEEGRSVNINPISALLGKLVNCDGITINFNSNVNFKA